MNASREQGLSRIRRAAAVVELRMRLARVMRVLPYVLITFIIVATVTIAARKLLFDHFSESRAKVTLIASGAVALLALIVAALRRLPPHAGSVALDKSHNLSDRLTNALSFAAVGEVERTPLMDVAIEDACARTTDLKPSKAAPIQAPWELLVAFALLAPLVAMALLEIRVAIPVPPPIAKTIDAPPMSPDDIELFKEAAREMERQNQSPEMKAAIDKFNQLIEDLANKRLDRTEAFRRMEELERELMKGAEMDAKKLEEELKNTGMELSKSDLAKPIGDALQKKDLAKAQKEMQALAEQLKSGKKLDKAALERLKKAMENAAKQRKEALAAINEKRQELRDEILKKKEEKKKKQDPDGGSKEDQDEEQLIKEKERQLERLDREAEQQERAGRSLDRLDRDLAKAAADLAKEMGLSAEDLEKAAEDINRMQQEEMSDKEKEELRKRLQELRELLRQQGQAGKERMKRMLKFGKRARGQSGQQGQGQQGQGQQGQGQDGEDGEDGEQGDQPGQGPGQNAGQGQGQGQGGQKGVTVGLGQGQGQGDGPGEGPGSGQGAGQNGGEANGGQPGQGWGTGHNSDIKGDRSDLKGQTTSTRAEAQDTGQGPSNSEVILAAAERGFKGGPYKKVYKDYRTHAESQINQDEIPDGYRFYVRRYFQLIRPRE
ncbi:MAG: hypothetical protein IPK82_27405 [Polyangiaceae bacterium]|nr:hypothetical protein [Polyangiaceae bacterium]